LFGTTTKLKREESERNKIACSIIFFVAKEKYWFHGLAQKAVSLE
jgi:hypothetical protein